MRRSLLNLAGVGAAFAVGSTWACQTPTSMTIEVTTDVPCGTSERRVANVVVGNPDSILNQLDASTSKSCEAEGPIGTVVLLPAEDENAEVAFKVILGVDRPTEACGVSGPPEAPEDVWSGCIIARRRLRFLAGEALLVRVPLLQYCKGTGCDEASFTTCVAPGTCAPSDLDPNDCLERACDDEELPGTVTTGAGTTVTSSSGGGEGGAGTASSSSESSTTASSSGSAGGGGEGGQSAGGGGAGGAGGADCLDPAECPDPGECASPTCEGGLCGDVPDGEGAPCDLGGAPGICDAGGACVECLTEAQCPAASGPCVLPICLSGACGEAPVGSGDPCPGGTCVGGVCDLDPLCEDNQDSGPPTESDVDCGQSCPDCAVGFDCLVGTDCETGYCDVTSVCALCGADQQCGPGNYCETAGAQDGWCLARKDPGAPCDRAAECASGACPDGFCCATPCAAACESCGATGVCEPDAAGTDPEAECSAGACRTGSCSGAIGCGFDPPGTTCGDAQSCVDGFVTVADQCNGQGTCMNGGTYDCPSGLCDGDVCDGLSVTSSGSSSGSTVSTSVSSSSSGVGGAGGGCIEGGGGNDGCPPGCDCAVGLCYCASIGSGGG